MGKIREEMEKVARENAIKELKELQIDIGSSPDDLDNSPLYYALDMAIKALEQQPCDNCVSKQKVNKLVDELARAISDERCCMSRGRSTASIMQDLLDLPSVTPSRPRGKWEVEHKSTDGYTLCVCSNCKDYYTMTHYEMKYCPNCGADMRGEKNEME